MLFSPTPLLLSAPALFARPPAPLIFAMRVAQRRAISCAVTQTCRAKSACLFSHGSARPALRARRDFAAARRRAINHRARPAAASADKRLSQSARRQPPANHVRSTRGASKRIFAATAAPKRCAYAIDERRYGVAAWRRTATRYAAKKRLMLFDRAEVARCWRCTDARVLPPRMPPQRRVTQRRPCRGARMNQTSPIRRRSNIARQSRYAYRRVAKMMESAAYRSARSVPQNME